ncbi:unnamed protein product, partial [Mesorhabditis spiculigera]
SKAVLSTAGRLSYYHAPSTVALWGETIGHRWRRVVEETPDKQFVVFPRQNKRQTYEQAYKQSTKLAASLLGLGLKPGDRVGLWGPNYLEWAETHFACAQAGLALVNVNPFYRAPELEYALKKVGCTALITPAKYRNSDYYSYFEEVVPEIAAKPQGQGAVASHNLPTLKHLIVFDAEDPRKKFSGAWNYAELLSGGAGSSQEKQLEEIAENTHFDRPFNIQFTSGTTGSPKAVTLSHFNVLNNARLLGLKSGFDKTKEVICVPNPLYHTFGCVAGLLNGMVHRQTLVFPSETFSAGAALKAIQSEKATFVYGTPTMFIDMINHETFANTDVSSVSGAYISAAPIPKPLLERMLDKMGLHRLMVLYGCTETSPVITAARLEQTPQERIRNSGYPLDHTETAVVCPQTRLPVPRGSRGELVTRGFHVMSGGYWNDAEKTKEAVCAQGWYRTGDIAVMQPDGGVQIVGRLKDMIIRGGENVYPTEIETCLFKHPAIADIHVIGVPDARLGEEVCAWVRLQTGKKLTADELKEYCKDKMARHSIPRYILFKTEADFPLTATGKVQKFEMRKITKRELGLDKVETHFNEE